MINLVYTPMFTVVAPSTVVTISVNSAYGVKEVIFYDIGQNRISSSLNSASFTTPSNCYSIKVSLIKIDGTTILQSDINSISSTLQIAAEASPSTYAPHADTSSYIPTSSNGCTNVNGVKTSIDLNAGTKTEPNSVKVLQASDIESMTTSRSNLDWANIAKPSGSAMLGNTLSGIMILAGYSETVTDDDAGNIGKFTSHIGLTYWQVGFAKGTTLAAAQAALTGVSFGYQLSVPVVTHIDGMGQLMSEPNGLVVVEPAVKFESRPVVGLLTIPNGWNAISAVESIRQITTDIEGNITYTDAAYITPIAGSTTIQLSAGYDDTKMYQTVYLYSNSLAPFPTITLSWPTNIQGEIDNIGYIGKQIAISLDDLNDFVIAQLIALNSASVISRAINIPLGAISATTTQIVMIARTAGYINKCKLVTRDAITANDSNYWTISLISKGVAGANSDVIATKTTQVTGGAGFAAYTAWDIGTLSATYKVMSADQVVVITLTKTGSATAFAESELMLEFVPTY